MTPEWWQAASSALTLILLAEIGDKSQFVCMTLAARYGQARLILLGATLAFAVLNGLAAVFGAAIAIWLPKVWVLGAASLLFAAFGVHALLQKPEEEETGTTGTLASQGLLTTTFLMISVAEMGDKTQIAVAGLSASLPASAVWIGATLGHIAISASGIYLGSTLLHRLPIIWLHRFAGAAFLLMAALSAWKLARISQLF